MFHPALPDSDLQSHGLLRFDVASAVPPGAHIIDAQMALYRNGGSGVSSSISAYPVLKPWTTNVNWWQYATGQPWTTPGGDFGPAAATVSVNPQVAIYRWNLTQLTRGSAAGAVANHGVLMTGGEDQTFASSEATNPSQRPSLTITYARPPSISLSGELYDERTRVESDGGENSAYLDSPAAVTVNATGHEGGIAAWNCGQRPATAPRAPLHPVLLSRERQPDVHVQSRRCRGVSAGRLRMAVIARDADAPPGSTTPGPDVSVSTFRMYVADPTDPGPDDPDSETDAPDPPGGEGPVSARTQAVALPEPEIPPLSDEQERAALDILDAAIAAQGHVLQRMLGDGAYRIESVGPATGGEAERPTIVGASFAIVLERTRSYDGLVPRWTSDGRGGPRVPYVARVVAPVVNDLLVEVSFSPQRVTSVVFGPDSITDVLEPIPGARPLPKPPADND